MKGALTLALTGLCLMQLGRPTLAGAAPAGHGPRQKLPPASSPGSASLAAIRLPPAPSPVKPVNVAPPPPNSAVSPGVGPAGSSGQGGLGQHSIKGGQGGKGGKGGEGGKGGKPGTPFDGKDGGSTPRHGGHGGHRPSRTKQPPGNYQPPVR